MGKKIKRFKLRDGVTLDSIRATHKNLQEGGSYIAKDAEWCMLRMLNNNICAEIGFPSDLSKWNDFDYILLIDDNWSQPYTPFYGENYGREITNFPFLEAVIEAYNECLSSMDFLEECVCDDM